ncbi:MAG: hypothetical protein Q9217_001256 [Psora testacea]
MALDSVLPGFDNLDDENVYNRCYQAIQSIDTLNFAIEFDSANAYAALNLNARSLQELLDTKAIAQKYDFSPRLEGIISSKPLTPRCVDTGLTKHSASAQQAKPSTSKNDRKYMDSQGSDPEKSGLDAQSLLYSSGLDLSHYKLVDEVWHYLSTDWTSKCI